MKKDDASLLRQSARNALRIGLGAAVFSLLFTTSLNQSIDIMSVYQSMLLLAGVVAIAITSDILAIAATAADEAPLHAMAAKKLAGAKEAAIIVRNRGAMNSIFADVVGDITGAVSGALGTSIILDLRALAPEIPVVIWIGVVLAVIAFITVGGKAFEKGYAVAYAVQIVFFAGQILYVVRRIWELPQAVRTRLSGS